MNTPAAADNGTWWDDEVFQDQLVVHLIYDHKFLKDCSTLLNPNDFKPIKGMKSGQARWIVAERALEHFEKFNEPIGTLVRADVLEYISNLGMGSAKRIELSEYVGRITKIKQRDSTALSEKIVRFKGQVLKASALQELTDLQNSGTMTDEKWYEISQKALVNGNGHLNTVSYLKNFESRQERRKLEKKRRRTPWTFIDPLDEILVHTVGPKELGLILAPYKRGKSSFLLWLSVAFALQRLNVLFMTLEDPKDLVEDRLDSIVTRVPVKKFSAFPRTMRERFTRFRGMVRSNIEIFDGTEEEITMSTVEKIVVKKINEGFVPQALLIDYDEKISASQHFKEKRFEIDHVYNRLQRVMAKYNLIGWVAAQTQRDTRKLKILTGDKVAEDIGKVRKVTCALGLGKGDWTDDSLYLWVAAHKRDRMDVGCEIVPDLERSVIFDREATRRAMRANQQKEEDDE